MSKTVLSSLFKKPATVLYPFVKKPVYTNTRGKIEIQIDKCIFCGICSKKCPSNAIHVSKPEKKWEISRLKCISCNYCVEACPKKCLVMENTYTSPFSAKEKSSMVDSRTQVPSPQQPNA